MADITTTVASPFIPQIFAQTGLEILRNNIVVANLVRKDSDITEGFNVGQTLNIPYTGSFSANAKVQGSPVTLQTPTATNTSVSLNKHYESSFLLEDIARTVAQPDYMLELMKGEVIALAEQVETDLLNLYSGFSYSAGTAGTNLAASDIRAVNKKFTDNKVPRGNRHMVIATKDTQNLLADSTLATYFAFNSGDRGDITNGLIAQDLYGVQIHESQLIPTTGSSPVNTHNLAFDPGAIILASRPLVQAPDNAGAQQAVVQDPTSGLILRVTMAYNPSYLGVQVTTDILYGVAILRDAKGFTYLS